MILEAFEPNPRARSGGNNPPPDPAETFWALKTHAEDLCSEAKGWLDGAAVESQGQADEIGKLLGMIREASGDIEKARKAEVKPLDDQKTAIQERFNALIGDNKSCKGILVRAQEACKTALAPWLRRQEEERQAEAKRLREEAEAKAAAAAEAARAAADAANLQASEDAEAMVRDAQAALKQAARAENAKANAGGGDYRAVGLRSVWTPSLTDAGAALKHYAQRRPDDLKAMLVKFAQEDVRAGIRSIPGFTVDETRVPV